jgi:hypothetical protein
MLNLVEMVGAKGVILGVGVVIAGLVLGIIYFGSVRSGDVTDEVNLKEGGEVGVPPIDVAAPVDTETATFALG